MSDNPEETKIPIHKREILNIVISIFAIFILGGLIFLIEKESNKETMIIFLSLLMFVYCFAGMYLIIKRNSMVAVNWPYKLITNRKFYKNNIVLSGLLPAFVSIFCILTFIGANGYDTSGVILDDMSVMEKIKTVLKNPNYWFKSRYVRIPVYLAAFSIIIANIVRASKKPEEDNELVL